MPLKIPFVWGVLFGMRLVNLQETQQVVCCQAHPCFEGHTLVAIIILASALVITIKAVGLLNSCFVCLNLRIPPFISKPKEIGGCIDGGHDSAAGPNSS
jgi:hypothetical protein